MEVKQIQIFDALNLILLQGSDVIWDSATRGWYYKKTLTRYHYQSKFNTIQNMMEDIANQIALKS